MVEVLRGKTYYNMKIIIVMSVFLVLNNFLKLQKLSHYGKL